MHFCVLANYGMHLDKEQAYFNVDYFASFVNVAMVTLLLPYEMSFEQQLHNDLLIS